MPGTQCSVGGCSNKREQNRSLHRFPTAADMKDKWVRAIKSTGTNVSRSSSWTGPKSAKSQLVCSEHFEFECFTLTTRLHWKEGLQYTAKLEEWAVPTLFGEKIATYKNTEPVLRAAFRKREVARIMKDYEETQSNSISTHQTVQTAVTENTIVEDHQQSHETVATEVVFDDNITSIDEHQDPVSNTTMPNGPQTTVDDGMTTQPANDSSVLADQNLHTCMQKERKLVINKRKKNPLLRHKSVQANLGKKSKVQTNTKRTQTLQRHHITMTTSSSQYCETDIEHKCSTPVKPVKKTRPPNATFNSPGLNSTLTSIAFSDNLEQDPDYNPDMTDYDHPSDDEFPETETDPKVQRKFVVFEENLMSLFRVCPECSLSSTADICQIQGSYIAVRQECSCGYQRRWESQPKVGTIPAGNIFLSACVLFSGCSPTKLFRVFSFFNLMTMTLDTFWDHQRRFLWPAIDQVWSLYKSTVHSALRDRGGHVIVAGDGRADSPGHSAKYGAYSMIDLQSGGVIDIQLVQSNEVKGSYHMELEGLKRAVTGLKKEGISITEIITDRHLQIQKWIRENLPETIHSFDVWHIVKGMKKKLLALGKERDCGIVHSWVKSITNHMYWSAASSRGDEGDMLLAKWRSLANHMQNIHTNHDGKFPNCLHEELTDREWLKPGTKACVKLEEIILNKRLGNDVKKMSTGYQTSSLEAFHSVINHFAPKMHSYSFYGQLCRQHLAALHFNENVRRATLTTQDGTIQVKVSFPKYKQNHEYSIKTKKEEMTFKYVGALLATTEKLCLKDCGRAMCTPAPPPLTALKRKPCKVEALSELKSRYAKIRKCLPMEEK